MKPRLVVIAGPNGSGKTSITEQFRDLRRKWMRGCVYVNPDEIARERFGDWNDPSAVLSAARYAENLRERLLQERADFAFETVLSTPEKVDFLKRAARIVSRMEDGGHAVPIEKIVSRYAKSLTNALLVARFAERAYFYDNSTEVAPGDVPVWNPLFRTKCGLLVEKYPRPDAHAWAAEIFDALKNR